MYCNLCFTTLIIMKMGEVRVQYQGNDEYLYKCVYVKQICNQLPIKEVF